MRVARQSWPDAAAGGLAYARLSSHESQAHSPGGTLAPLAARHPTGPLRAGLEELRARSLADALAGVGARLGPRDAAGLGAARPGGVARGARRAGERGHDAARARGGQPGAARGQAGGRPGAAGGRRAAARRARGRFPRGPRRCRGVRLPVRAPPVRADPAPADSVPGARGREPRRSVCDARARGRVRAQLGRVVHRHRQRGAHQHRLRARAVAGGPRAARRAVGPPGGAPVIVHETARLKLRELGADDAAFILELVNEPGWLRFVGDRNVHSLDDARGYIARGPAASYEKHGFGLWAVELAASGEAVGLCGRVRGVKLGAVVLGYARRARHWGQGYAREAAAAVVTLARERYRLAKLVAITDVDNLASQKVLASVGFLYDKPVHVDDTGGALSLYVLALGVPQVRPGRHAP